MTRKPTPPRSLDWIEARSIPVPETGCWIWLGSTTKKGNAQVGFNRADGKRSSATAASVAYAAAYGPESLAGGMLTLQVCNQILCVYPGHLRVASRKEHRHLLKLSGSVGHVLSYLIAARIRRASGAYWQIAARFGISKRMVWLVKSGRSWNRNAANQAKRQVYRRHWYGRLDFEYRQSRHRCHTPLTKPEDFDADADRRSELLELSMQIAYRLALCGRHERAT